MSNARILRSNYPYIENNRHAEALEIMAEHMAEKLTVAAAEVIRENEMAIRDGTLSAVHGALLMCEVALSTFRDERVDDEMLLTMLHEAAEFFNTRLVETAKKRRRAN